MATISSYFYPSWFKDAIEGTPDDRLIAGDKEYTSVVDPEYHWAKALDKSEKEDRPLAHYAGNVGDAVYGVARGVPQNLSAGLLGANELLTAPIGEYFQEGGFDRIMDRAGQAQQDRRWDPDSKVGRAAMESFLSPLMLFEGATRATAESLQPLIGKHAAAAIYGGATTFPIGLGTAIKSGALNVGRRQWGRYKAKKDTGKEAADLRPISELNNMLDKMSLVQFMKGLGENSPIALFEQNWGTIRKLQNYAQKKAGVGAEVVEGEGFLKRVGKGKPVPEDKRVGFYSGPGARVFSLAKGFMKGVGGAIRTHMEPDAAYRMMQSGLSQGAITEIKDALTYSKAMAAKHGAGDKRAIDAMKTVYAQLQYSHIFNLKTGRVKVGDMDDMSRLFQVFYPNLTETRGVITPQDAIELTGTDVNSKFLAPLLDSAYGEVGFKINPGDRVIYGAKSFRKKTGMVHNELSSTPAHKLVTDFVDNSRGTTAAELRDFVDQVRNDRYTSQGKEPPGGRFPTRIKAVNIDGREYIHYVITKPGSDQLLGGIRADYLLDTRTRRAIEVISDETDLLGGVAKEVMNLASNRRFATIHIRERTISQQAGASATFERDMKLAFKRIDEIDNVDIPALSIQADKVISNPRVGPVAKEKRLNSLSDQKNKLLAEKDAINGLYPFSKYSGAKSEIKTVENWAKEMQQYSRDVVEWKKLKASGAIRKNAARPVKPKIDKSVVESGKWDQTFMDDIVEKLMKDPDTPLSYILQKYYMNTLGAQVQGVGISRENQRNQLELGSNFDSEPY